MLLAVAGFCVKTANKKKYKPQIRRRPTHENVCRPFDTLITQGGASCGRFRVYSEHYVIEASPWGVPSGSGIPVSPEEEKIVMDIAEHFYDFTKEYDPDRDGQISQCGGNSTAFWFKLYSKGDKCSFYIDQPGTNDWIYSYNKDGLIKFCKNMRGPSIGKFDTVMFK